MVAGRGSPSLDVYLLDTDVLSNLSKQKQCPALFDWFVRLHPKQFCLAMCTVFELQRGIELLRLKNPALAAEKERWLEELLRARPKIIQADLAITREHASLAAVPDLQHFDGSDAGRRSVRPSQDLLIAATAIVMDATIATFNTKDFLKIHTYSKLPGLYHPGHGQWAVRARRRRRSDNSGNRPSYSGWHQSFISMPNEKR